MKNDNQTFHGDQTRCEKKILMSRPQMLTLDLVQSCAKYLTETYIISNYSRSTRTYLQTSAMAAFNLFNLRSASLRIFTLLP